MGKAGESPALVRNGNIRKNKVRFPAFIWLVSLSRDKGGRVIRGDSREGCISYDRLEL